jgi:cryptochrome
VASDSCRKLSTIVQNRKVGFVVKSGSCSWSRASVSRFLDYDRNPAGTMSFKSPLLPAKQLKQQLRSVDQSDVVICWFRNTGLRLHDNAAFRNSCTNSHANVRLIPLYILDPSAPMAQSSVDRRVGCLRVNFVLESLKDLNAGILRDSGGKNRLITLLGDPVEVLPQIVEEFRASALHFERDPGSPVQRKVDQQVLSILRERTHCAIHRYDTHTIHPLESYLAASQQHTAPSTYTGFQKIFNKLTVPPCLDSVTEVPPLPDDFDSFLSAPNNGMEEAFRTMGSNEVSPDQIVTLLERLGYSDVGRTLQNRSKGGIDFTGGENAGLSLLQRMMSRASWVATFEKPNTSPNALTVDTTGLSPYVKHGCISCRLFYHELSKACATSNIDPQRRSKPPVSLHGQLMWREYNYLMGYTTPNFDTMANNPIARQIPWRRDPRVVEAWRNSETGYPFIDAVMTQLRETGWIHHLARHSVACFLTRGDLWQSWEDGAAVFEELLIDADWSINNFNWQWLSCTAHFYQYFRCYSPVAFGKKTDKNGDYIRKWLPQFKTFPSKFIYEPWEAPLQVQLQHGVVVGTNYPRPLVSHAVASKENMTRMSEAYEAQKNGMPMPAPPEPFVELPSAQRTATETAKSLSGRPAMDSRLAPVFRRATSAKKQRTDKSS